jgi:hypothetical protein
MPIYGAISSNMLIVFPSAILERSEETKDSDNDGIPDYLEEKYHTDPDKPNRLLSYALKKLPEDEALRFKDVEYNDSSKGLVDLLAQLLPDNRSRSEVYTLLNMVISDNAVNKKEKMLKSIRD